MDYKVEKEAVIFDGYYKILKANIIHDALDGDLVKIERLAFHRGNSAAILLYEKETNSIILTKQFRYPATKNGDSWLVEIPAGAVEKNEQPQDCIVRECLEETGYTVKNPKKIFQFYNSPGASTEKSYLYYAEVKPEHKVEKGGGLASEKEDIAIIRLQVHEIEDWLNEKIIDAKTIMALQWFLTTQNKAAD